MVSLIILSDKLLVLKFTVPPPPPPPPHHHAGLKRGASSIDGFKGLLNLHSMVKQNEIEMGKEAAKDLFEDRLLVMIDPGCKVLAGITFCVGKFNDVTEQFEGDFKRRKFSDKEFKAKGGVDRRADDATRRVNGNNATLLSHHHARTLDPDALRLHHEAFARVEQEMMEHANSRAERRELARTKRKQQRYWSELVNWILAFQDDMLPNSDKAPIIIFGIPPSL